MNVCERDAYVCMHTVSVHTHTHTHTHRCARQATNACSATLCNVSSAQVVNITAGIGQPLGEGAENAKTAHTRSQVFFYVFHLAIIFYSVLFCFNLFYSVLFYCVLFYFICRDCENGTYTRAGSVYTYFILF